MSIPHLDISGGDTTSDLQVILNQVVDKVIDTITYPNTRTIRITFQDATYKDITLPDIPDRVITGCGITRTGAGAYTVAAGSAQAGGTVFTTTSTSVTLAVADGTYTRYDALVVTNQGVVTYRTGVAGASPALPTLNTGDLLLAYIERPKLGGPADFIMTTVAGTLQGRSSRVVLSASGSVLPHQQIIFADSVSASGTFNITLPDPATAEGIVFRVFDMGNASGNNVLIKTPSGTVSGGTDFTLNQDYQEATFTAYDGDYYGG